MESNERTRDVYEEIAGYPKPPLVPLPEPGDLDSLEPTGLKINAVSRRIVNAAMFATGFRAFQQQLPNNIEGLLRHANLRGSILFAPMVSATLALQDDPRDLRPIARAATLLLAARGLYEDITSARLPADTYRGQVLEMGQYPNLFSTSLIIEGKRPRIFKSSDMSQVAVAIARRFYSLKVWSPGAETGFGQLIAGLSELARTAQQNRLRADEPPLGILTCATDQTQRRAFQRLQRVRTNAQALSALRHSFLVLCLDLDSYPSSYAEAAFMAHSGNCANRWYHASLQLVVFGNAKACVICNFSTYLDGNTMMRAASELQKRAAAWPIERDVSHQSAPAAPCGPALSATSPNTYSTRSVVSHPKSEIRNAECVKAAELKWQAGAAPLEQAQKDLRSVLDNQQATFEITGIGRAFFAAHNVDAVPAFILALQMAAKRFTGKTVRISQFLAMSRYRCMDLTTAMVTTPEVVRFVEYMEQDNVQAEQALGLLRAAVSSQVQVTRQVRQRLPLSRLFSLYALSLSGPRRLYALGIASLTGALLRGLRLYRPIKREVLVSHPEIYPEVPVVGRPGIRLPYVKYFGLHYQVLDDRIVITMMPALKWTIPNAEFIAVLQECLERLRSIISHASPIADSRWLPSAS